MLAHRLRDAADVPRSAVLGALLFYVPFVAVRFVRLSAAT